MSTPEQKDRLETGESKDCWLINPGMPRPESIHSQTCVHLVVVYEFPIRNGPADHILFVREKAVERET
jgi:hypothetical protein